MDMRLHPAWLENQICHRQDSKTTWGRVFCGQHRRNSPCAAAGAPRAGPFDGRDGTHVHLKTQGAASKEATVASRAASHS
eukprot:5313953-Pyramimonas_sp.AAC.1